MIGRRIRLIFILSLAFMSGCVSFQIVRRGSRPHAKQACFMIPPRCNIEQGRKPTSLLSHYNVRKFTATKLHSSNDTDKQETETNRNKIEPSCSSKTTRLYFDIEINKEEIGRLVFQIDTSEDLPTHIYTSNLMKICSGQRSSIDPKCKYVGCQFQHSPQSVETFPQYRWTHVLCGNGRNAVGPPTERIPLSPTMSSCAHSLYGGQYYGRKYETLRNVQVEEEENSSESSNYDFLKNEYGVYLTVPLVGPQRGSSSFSIVRVDESPQEWRERLLLNSAVLGILESGIETLWAMAKQTDGPPTIIRSGVL